MSADPDRNAVTDPSPAESGSKSGGGRLESRLMRLETHMQYLATREDLQKLEIQLQYLATKEDLQKLKVWWLGGIITGMALAATVAIAVLRIFATVVG